MRTRIFEGDGQLQGPTNARAGNIVKAACMSVLLLSTAILLAMRGEREILVSHLPLDNFPEVLGREWSGHALAIDARTVEVLGAGDFTERIFESNTGAPPIDLFIGYFPTQRTGVTIHSPKNCLPGSGWFPLQSKRVAILSGGRAYPVNEYVIQKGDQKQLVLYWYQSHGRLVASEYAAKFYLVADSITMNRSDAALVRIVTPLSGGETASHAESRALQFARTLLPSLEKYIPA